MGAFLGVTSYHFTGWLNEIIWNNTFLRINGKPLFRSKLLTRKDFYTVNGLLTDFGKMKSRRILQNNVTCA